MKALNGIRNHGRMLVVASLLTVAAMGLPGAVGVHAMDNGGLGEAGVCYYDGKAYSEGAKITLQDGTVQNCQKDGTWGFQMQFRGRFVPISGLLASR